jgi:ferrous iron transport protein B
LIQDKKYHIYLAGNPNAGKTSLFNHLTGLNQRTANYPGITVEKKSAQLRWNQTTFEIVDLPGTYSLYPNSPDEKVVIDELLTEKQDLIIVVCDSTNLLRGLLLYTQIADFDKPVIVVLNMMDELASKGYEIDLTFLEKEIGVPVFVCNSKTGEGVSVLKKYIEEGQYRDCSKYFFKKDLFHLNDNAESLTYFQWHQFIQAAPQNALSENIKRLETLDRYNQIEKINQLTTRPTAKSLNRKRKSEQIDKLLMHPVFGYVSFLFILYIVFQSIFTIAAVPMDWIDQTGAYFSTIYRDTFPNSLIVKMLSDGILPGITGVLMFVPQIALLFFFITILEESGYMARVVFLMDKIMRSFGLSGKSILPLISGNACAIPAILSTRSINNTKERLITILAIPFTTCSARLPVYAILIALIIPLQFQGLALMGLYLIGMLSAFLIAVVLNKIIPDKEPSTLILELPPLRLPSLRNSGISVRNAIMAFVSRAGKIILAFTIILWVMSSFGPKNFSSGYGITTPISIEESFAGNFGQTIEPIFKPLGYDWKIDIALITSFAAREVFVSTLATIYSFDENESDAQTIQEKLRRQINEQTQQPVFTTAVSASLLVFYIFALQCFSTIGAIRAETNSYRWAAISFFIMSVIAYTFSFLTYQFLK